MSELNLLEKQLDKIQDLVMKVNISNVKQNTELKNIKQAVIGSAQRVDFIEEILNDFKLSFTDRIHEAEDKIYDLEKYKNDQELLYKEKQKEQKLLYLRLRLTIYTAIVMAVVAPLIEIFELRKFIH